ncbi:hypothetical protein BDA96_09G113000 [Sorghum bicolor]|uniref:Uncharacterized protein n=1 Tax=Sorghum bicolor TaxID=4558 RepID=A0A921Q9X7_SORBI|nr:hypothetical protein BDA96_09G113000 [Sorghum bicolor]
MFVECFKPDGWMSNFVVSCHTNLWNKEWGYKTIISQLAMQELLGDKGDRLAKELNEEVLGRTNMVCAYLLSLIFVTLHLALGINKFFP